MTETAVETEAGWGDEPAQGPATYPQYPDNPHNHRFTISIDGRGPMLVIRANTGAEITAAAEELEDPAAGAAIGRAWAAFKAGAALGNGLGATPAPAGPPAPAPQGATPPPFGPNVSVPQAPGYQGPPAPQAPAAPAPGQWSGQAQGGGQNSRGPKPRPNWASVYKIEVPYPARDQFKQFREQYKDAFKGKVAWAGGGAYWIEGSVVQSFGAYTPVPA